MYIKKRFYRIMLATIILFVCMWIMWFIFATTTIKIKTSPDRIAYFVYNSTEIQPEDYKKVIARIENMRFYYTQKEAQTREMDVYIVIRDIKGNEERITSNDHHLTHIYAGEIIESYTVPFLTQIFLYKH